jgi:DNA-directed RNA polymerase subunit RPC12/RpoP
MEKLISLFNFGAGRSDRSDRSDFSVGSEDSVQAPSPSTKTKKHKSKNFSFDLKHIASSIQVEYQCLQCGYNGEGNLNIKRCPNCESIDLEKYYGSDMDPNREVSNETIERWETLKTDF